MEELIHFDKQLLLLLNGSDSLFLDSLIMTLTTAQTWIPLYMALFYVVWKANRTPREIFFIVAAAGLCVLLAGGVDDEIVKPLVARWRPTHDPEIGSLIDTVNGYRGGNYGFFSAHAANTFSLAVFLLVGRSLTATHVFTSEYTILAILRSACCGAVLLAGWFTVYIVGLLPLQNMNSVTFWFPLSCFV